MADSLNNNPNFVRTRLVRFPNSPLRFDQIASFISIVKESVGKNHPAFSLFHNHFEKENGSSGDKNEYPLVQYRVIDGCAAIFGINEGCEAIDAFLNAENLKKEFYFKEEPRIDPIKIEPLSQPKAYFMTQWWALNTDNYAEFKQCIYLVDRIALLERILTNQIKGFLNAVGYRYPDDNPLWVKILDCKPPVSKKFTSEKGKISVLAFQVMYHTNLMMPNHVGIGKGKSKGYSIQLYS